MGNKRKRNARATRWEGARVLLVVHKRREDKNGIDLDLDISFTNVKILGVNQRAPSLFPIKLRGDV